MQDTKLVIEDSIEGLIECDNCGDSFDTDDIITNEHGEYCESCENELFSMCGCCDKTIYTDDAIYQDGKNHCESCFDDRYTTCYNCSETVNNDDLYTNDIGSGYCQECYFEYYTSCETCDCELDRNEAFSTEDGTYCEGCCPNENHCEHLYSYDFRPPLDFYKIDNKDKFFLGIELECDGGEGDDFDVVEDLLSNKELYFKEDGSLDCGFEMVSHPMTLEYHQQYKWEGILKSIKNSGFRSFNAGTCGLHIHVPKKLLTHSEQIKLAMLVYTNPEFFQKLAQRSSSSYAKYKQLESMKDTIDGTKYNHDRHEAINFQNDDTIEFRMFKGTLKHESFMACIELVHALVNFVKTTKTKDVYKKNMFKSDFRNGAAYKNFCVFVCNSKDYKYLVSYMKSKKAFVTY